MKPLNLRANGGKHQKLLLGNNAPGKCLHAHMQHFFSRRPAIKKTFAESAFFLTKIKNLSWNRWIYEPMGEKHQKLLLGNNAPGKCLHAHMQHFSALAPLSRKHSLSQHFFLQKSKTCHETVEFTSQWGQNTKNYSWATMPLASAFRPTCNISSAVAPLSRKKSLSQHFFIQKSKTCHETVEFTSQTGQNTKNYSWATMPLASAFTPTCNISSALAPLSRRNSLSQHFFIYKNQKLAMKLLNLRANGGKHQKLLWATMLTGKCLHAHMQYFFSRSPAIEKTFAESAFFHTKIKNLSWNRWIYEPMGAKHQKLLPGQQCPWQVPSRPHATFLQP